MFFQPFSFQGRINRFEYGITLILSIFLFYITNLISSRNSQTINEIMYFLPTLWLLFAQGTKREHDMGYCGWVQFMPFRIFWLLFSKGEKTDNKYGVCIYKSGN